MTQVAEQGSELKARRARPMLGAVIFVLLAALFAGAVILIQPMFVGFSRLVPGSYLLQAQDLLAEGKTEAARALLKKQLQRQDYDFDARFLLAETYGRDAHWDQAVQEVLTILNKARSARNRPVLSSGFDEGTAYFLLGHYLWKSGNYISAGEAFRAAIDAGRSGQVEYPWADQAAALDTPSAAAAVATLALKMNDRPLFDRALESLVEQGSEDARARGAALKAQWLADRNNGYEGAQAALMSVDNHEDHLYLQSTSQSLCARFSLTKEPCSLSLDPSPPGKVNFANFSQDTGTELTTDSLLLSRNSSVSARIDTGVYRVHNLLVRASGTSALGMAPLLVIRSGEEELARLYLDGPQPRDYDLELWPDGAPKSLPLTFAFINDAYDPGSGADRNVTIHDVVLY